jgi:hypothetical protein
MLYSEISYCSRQTYFMQYKQWLRVMDAIYGERPEARKGINLYETRNVFWILYQSGPADALVQKIIQVIQEFAEACHTPPDLLR